VLYKEKRPTEIVTGQTTSRVNAFKKGRKQEGKNLEREGIKRYQKVHCKEELERVNEQGGTKKFTRLVMVLRGEGLEGS